MGTKHLHNVIKTKRKLLIKQKKLDIEVLFQTSNVLEPFLQKYLFTVGMVLFFTLYVTPILGASDRELE